MIADWSDESLRVGWVGGLYIEFGGLGLMINATEGTTERWNACFDPSLLEMIAVSDGEIRSLGGLLPLLCSLERRSELRIWAPMGEERPAYLAEAWSRGWPNRYPLGVEAEFPGGSFRLGDMKITSIGLRRSTEVAFRIDAGGRKIGFLPSGYHEAVVRHLRRMDLLVVIGDLNDVSQVGSLEPEQLWALNADGHPLEMGES